MMKTFWQLGHLTCLPVASSGTCIRIGHLGQLMTWGMIVLRFVVSCLRFAREARNVNKTLLLFLRAFAKPQDGRADLDPIAILQGRSSIDSLTVEERAAGRLVV